MQKSPSPITTPAQAIRHIASMIFALMMVFSLIGWVLPHPAYVLVLSFIFAGFLFIEPKLKHLGTNSILLGQSTWQCLRLVLMAALWPFFLPILDNRIKDAQQEQKN